ncbi:hypothetical protein VP1G_11127 [Cytospora mali]|uniref:Uncharacterized protein n=1 Tax=Cytospora mali TaxID=578113 RepID=A0A194V6I5_CYTMA|nr:hypothetical protein VP1G_11127 [Valsa mali var. pyri (nom. inval.)]
MVPRDEVPQHVEYVRLHAAKIGPGRDGGHPGLLGAAAAAALPPALLLRRLLRLLLLHLLLLEPGLIIPRHEQRPPSRRLLAQHIAVHDIQVPPQNRIDPPPAAPVLAPPVLPRLRPGRRRFRKQRRVAQVPLGRHDGVGARGVQTPLQVPMLQDVPVGEDDRLGREVLPQVPDVRPVRHPRQVALLLAAAAVHGEDARAGAQHVARVRERRLPRVQDADLGRHRHGQALVQRPDHVVDERLVLLQERPVVALARDALRAPEVQVHGVAVRRGQERRREERLRVVGAELHEERAGKEEEEEEEGVARSGWFWVEIGEAVDHVGWKCESRYFWLSAKRRAWNMGV